LVLLASPGSALAAPTNTPATPGIGPAHPAVFAPPEGRALSSWVTVTVRPRVGQAGAYVSLPVDCDEVLISEAGEQSKYAALIPPGYSWRFSNGYGHLSDSTGLFTRAFVVTLPGASALLLKSQLRRLAASCFSQATSDASGHSYPPLQDALDAMALAVIGLKPKTLAQFFPVAFESQTGDLGQTVQLLALTTNQPAAVESASVGGDSGLATVWQRAGTGTLPSKRLQANRAERPRCAFRTRTRRMGGRPPADGALDLPTCPGSSSYALSRRGGAFDRRDRSTIRPGAAQIIGP
jgi:hypothetical protein